MIEHRRKRKKGEEGRRCDRGGYETLTAAAEIIADMAEDAEVELAEAEGAAAATVVVGEAVPPLIPSVVPFVSFPAPTALALLWW